MGRDTGPSYICKGGGGGGGVPHKFEGKGGLDGLFVHGPESVNQTVDEFGEKIVECRC